MFEEIIIDDIAPLCALIVTIGGAIAMLYRGYRELKKPNEKIIELLKKHDNRIEELEDGQKETTKEVKKIKRLEVSKSKGMLALLDHEISGNHVENLKEVRKDLQNAIIENE